MQSTFRIESRHEPDCLHLSLWGVIDEYADLLELARTESAEIQIDLSGVRRINSYGVKAWVDAVRRIPRTTRLVFVKCPPPVIDQCNMVIGFLGHGAISSFFAPMVCEDCDEQLDQLYTIEDCRALGGKLPITPCPSCHQDMEVDDLEEQYLFFMRQD